MIQISYYKYYMNYDNVVYRCYIEMCNGVTVTCSAICKFHHVTCNLQPATYVFNQPSFLCFLRQQLL